MKCMFIRQNVIKTYLAPRLKKEYSYTSTPRLGLRGLFWGELYISLLTQPLLHEMYVYKTKRN